jgi:hypothetical protein
MKMSRVDQKRSKLSIWLEQHDKDIEWLTRASGIKRKTVEELAENPYKNPRMITIRKIFSVVKKIDPTIKVSDLWDMK